MMLDRILYAMSSDMITYSQRDQNSKGGLYSNELQENR